jgi:hypothetical protein
MATDHTVQAVIGLSGFRVDSGGFPMSREHVLRFELPPRFDAEHIELARRDFEVLASKAAHYPAELVDFQNAVLAHDLPRAGRLARDIGLTPEQLHEEGGGAAEVALVGGIIAVLILAGAWVASDSPSPPPQPGPEAGPPPTGGPSDAGADG